MKLSLITSALISIVTLSAAAPKGDYVLLDQGVAAGQNFSILGLLTLDGAGNITGNEIFHSSGASVASDLTGTYVMTSATSGTLMISIADPSGLDGPALVQSYRFLLAGSGELRAIRTDSGVFSVSSIAPSLAIPRTGKLEFDEVDRNSAMLGQIVLDGNGALAGSAVLLSAAGSSNSVVSGTYSAPVKGLGTLVVNLTGPGDDGTDQTATQTYRTAATRDGIVAIRTDSGKVSIANLEVQ